MGRHRSRNVLALIAAVGLAAPALAHPFTLNVTSGSASITSASSSSPWVIHISVTAGWPAVFTLTTSDANTVLESVTVECDADARMTINESSTGTFAMIGDVLEASSSSPESFDIDTIDISGTLGSEVANEFTVAAESIQQLRIGGDLTAEIIAGPRASLADSDIELIDVGGTLLGNISAEYGTIEVIDVAGDIGVPSSTGPYINADGIESLIADSITSFIDVQGPLNRMETRSGEFYGGLLALSVEENVNVADPGIFIDGPWAGELFVGPLTVPIEITGDFSGELFVNGDMDIGSSTRGDITVHGKYVCTGSLNHVVGGIATRFTVGGTFDGNRLAVGALNVSGTPGQIIINANDDSEVWDADVRVNGTDLSPKPFYANTGLVGGVGEVPFAAHDDDCIPPNGGTAVSGAFSVTLRFYGPVTWDAGFPFIIEYWNGSSWVNDNSFWMVNFGEGTRTITLLYVDENDPSIIPGGRDYRITPVTTGTNKLLCDKLLTVSDVLVDFFTYEFSSI